MNLFRSRSYRSIARTALIGAVSLFGSLAAFAADTYEYRVLATNKTSTMEKEMNEAAAAGYEFSATMGGETAFGGKEVVLVMTKASSAGAHKRYKLLATNKTSTMQKEISEMGAEGFEYKGQTVFESTFGGREVAVILELDSSKPPVRIDFKLLATSKTSTMQKELGEAGREGFGLVGLTVGKTAMGGSEVVSILRRLGK
ncbi:MAG: hypothetical protein WDO18_09850 [Acidobacteriota bacterium]